MARIVVGIDGSDGSARALRWAVDEARLRGADLEVVHAYSYPVSAAPVLIEPMWSSEELQRAAEEVVEEALAAVDTGGITVHREVVTGGAAAMLRERAEGADLVVVGARGLGGFRGLLLGSVSQQTVTHAPCPVVTVGPDR